MNALRFHHSRLRWSPFSKFFYSLQKRLSIAPLTRQPKLLRTSGWGKVQDGGKRAAAGTYTFLGLRVIYRILLCDPRHIGESDLVGWWLMMRNLRCRIFGFTDYEAFGTSPWLNPWERENLRERRKSRSCNPLRLITIVAILQNGQDGLRNAFTCDVGGTASQ